MTTINWTISKLDRRVDDGGVITAHWNVYAVDGDHTATAYGSESFAPNPSDSNFVPYEKLTEEIILGWVWGTKRVNRDDIEARMIALIEKKKNPPVISGLPWVGE